MRERVEKALKKMSSDHHLPYDEVDGILEKGSFFVQAFGSHGEANVFFFYRTIKFGEFSGSFSRGIELIEKWLFTQRVTGFFNPIPEGVVVMEKWLSKGGDIETYLAHHWEEVHSHLGWAPELMHLVGRMSYDPNLKKLWLYQGHRYLALSQEIGGKKNDFYPFYPVISYSREDNAYLVNSNRGEGQLAKSEEDVIQLLNAYFGPVDWASFNEK